MMVTACLALLTKHLSYLENMDFGKWAKEGVRDGSEPSRLVLYMKTHPLLAYAFCHWGSHARASATEHGALHPSVDSFLKQCSTIVDCMRVDITHELPYPATGLHLAAKHGLVDAITQLSPTVNHPASAHYTPFHLAAANNRGDFLKRLRAPNSGPSSHPSTECNIQTSDGRTPLSYACEAGHLEIVQSLLSHPSIDPNLQDSNGRTPLSYACQAGNLEIAQSLLSHPDTNCNLQESDGDTPLRYACRKGHLEVVWSLLSHPGIEYNLQGWERRTLLSSACRNGDLEIVRALLALPNIKCNLQDHDGNSPLINACSRGDVNVVNLMLDHPSTDITISNKHGLTAMDITCSQLANSFGRYDSNPVEERATVVVNWIQVHRTLRARQVQLRRASSSDSA